MVQETIQSRAVNNERQTRWKQVASLCALLLLWPATLLEAGDPLVWRADKNEVDADIKSWPLPKVLETVAGATGWRVYVEPEAERMVSTRFERLPPPEALGRLLGGLNFALLSATNAPAKLFVYQTTVEKATHQIQPPRVEPTKPAGRVIGNELVITLKPGSKASIERLAQRWGAKIVGRIDDQNTYRLQFESEEDARKARSQISEDEDIASVDSNYAIQLPSRIESLGGSGLVPPLALKPGTLPNGDYLVVALIDTPVQREGSSIKDFLLPNVSLAGDAATPATGLAHGTAMADTILRAAASNLQNTDGTPIRILPMDVYGSQPMTSTFEVASALQALLGSNDSRIRIVNLSLGSSVDASYVRQAIETLSQRGVLIVGAAGNEPVTTPVYPAAYPEVLAVTAGDRQGNIAPYANHGEFVDAVMPGASFVQFGGQQYLVTGTSSAAATASGTVAAEVVSTGSTPQTAAQRLRQAPRTSRPGG